MSAQNTIDLSLPSDVAIRRIYQDFRVCLPAAALNFDRDASLVTASPRVQFMLYNREVMVDPDVPSVPVLHYGGGGYGVWFDVADSDPLLMVAADGPVTGFYSSGGASPPGAATTSHTWGCAVALPCGRVSDPAAPTPPPNAKGEFLMGAADGSAAVVLRAAGVTSPAETGTVVVQAANVPASVRIGADDATLGVVRLGDAVAPDATWTAFATAVAGFINGLAPGTVVVPNSTKVGVTSEASTVVVSK